MWEDPIVEEIRKKAEEYAAQFQFDLVGIFGDLKRKESESGRKVVSHPPKRRKADALGAGAEDL
jgi:hypothetical protein